MDDSSKQAAGSHAGATMIAQQVMARRKVVTPDVYYERRASKILPWVASNLVAYGPFSKLPREVQPLPSVNAVAQRAGLANAPRNMS